MEWARYLRIAVYSLVFILPFIGLIVANGYFFPFITGKNFAFRIIVELAFGLWLILALIQPEFRPRKSVAFILGGLFVLAIGVSTLIAENPVKAFWSNFERMEGYITVLHLALYVTVLTSMLRTEEWWRRFFNVSIGASVLIGLFGVLQLLGAFTINQGGVRVDGTLGNATYLAVYMLIHAFLTLLALVRWSGGKRSLQALYAGIFVLQVVVIFYTATRGTIVGLVGGLFLAGLIAAVTAGKGRLRALGIGLVILVLALTGTFFAIKDTAFVQQHDVLTRIASISLEAGATRFVIWDMALQGFMERPIFGWGQEGFNNIFNKYYTADLYTQEPWFDRAHSVPLDWLVAGGIVGMLLYLSLYAVLVYYLWRPGNTFDTAERAILTGLLAAYACHNLVVFDNLMSYLLFGAVFAYITVRAVPPSGWGQAIPEPAQRLAAPAIIIATLAALYFVNIPAMATAQNLIQGIVPQQEGIAKNVEYMTEAAAHSGIGAQEVAEQYLQFAVQLRSYNVGTPEQQQQVAGAARDRFLLEIERAPEDARLRVFFGAYLRQFGDYVGAKEQLDKALTLSPEKQSIYFELGTLALQQGDVQGSLTYFKDAYELAPGYEMAAQYYASGLIRAGQPGVAEQILLERYQTVTPLDINIAQAYLAAKDYPKAITIFRARAEKELTSRAYVDLAVVQLDAGDRLGAVASLRQAIVVDPTFKQQGESYIADIEAGRNPQ
ncbi:MAG: O-antigen ligase family protein [Patescibacteria group bacterium]